MTEINLTEMQICSIKRNYSSNYGGVFLYKGSSCTKHNGHCIIRFLVNAVLLNVYFILNYHLFFCKVIYFFNCLYFRYQNAISKCLDVFFDRKRGHQLSTCATGRRMADHPKCSQQRTGGEGGFTSHVYVRG